MEFSGCLRGSIAALPETLYQTAFVVSVDLVLADGIVRDEEEECLYRLQHALNMDSSVGLADYARNCYKKSMLTGIIS